MTAPSWNEPSGGWGRWSWGKWGSSVADEPRPNVWATASRDSGVWWSSVADDPKPSWTSRWGGEPPRRIRRGGSLLLGRSRRRGGHRHRRLRKRRRRRGRPSSRCARLGPASRRQTGRPLLLLIPLEKWMVNFTIHLIAELAAAADKMRAEDRRCAPVSRPPGGGAPVRHGALHQGWRDDARAHGGRNGLVRCSARDQRHGGHVGREVVVGGRGARTGAVRGGFYFSRLALSGAPSGASSPPRSVADRGTAVGAFFLRVGASRACPFLWVGATLARLHQTEKI